MGYYMNANDWWNAEDSIAVEIEYKGLSLIVGKSSHGVEWIEWRPRMEGAAKEGAAFIAWMSSPHTDDETKASVYDAICGGGDLTGSDFGEGLSEKEFAYIIECAINEAQETGQYREED